MSKSFTFECDECQEHEDAKELRSLEGYVRYIAPTGWMTLMDADTGNYVDMHYCNGCKPGFEAPRVINPKKETGV